MFSRTFQSLILPGLFAVLQLSAAAVPSGSAAGAPQPWDSSGCSFCSGGAQPMPTCFLSGLWKLLEAKSLLHLSCWRTKPLPPAFRSQCHLKHARILPWAWHSLQNATALQQESTRTLHFMREKSSCFQNKAMPLLGWGSKYTCLEFPHTWCSPKMCLLRACSHASNMLPLSFPYAVICFKKLYKLSVKSFLYISFGLFHLIFWINFRKPKRIL